MKDTSSSGHPASRSDSGLRPVFGRYAAARSVSSPTANRANALSAFSDKPTSPLRDKPVRTAQKTLSEEQLRVVKCRAGVCVVNAFAGTGKTTTAEAVAREQPTERILYLSLNKANQIEAAARFPSNVTAMTTHALALSQVGPILGSRTRVVQQWRALTLRQELDLPSTRSAALCQSVLKEFFKSEDLAIDETHASEIADTWNATGDEAMDSIARARSAWSLMRDPSSRVSIPPDAYLKMFALSSPRLPFDRIIFDEAQDSNPVTAQIIKEQVRKNSARVLCIGDRHQSIYAFRGSIDAMAEFAGMGDAEVLDLTTTWRFGPEIAGFANTLLRELKNEKTRIVGAGGAGAWDPSRYTHLARTNSQLISIAAARSGRGIHWLGGPDSYRLSTVEDAYHLFNREPQKIQDRFYQNFTSWQAFEEYATNARDSDARIILRIIAEHLHDTPELLRDIRANAVSDPESAELVLTTAHKSKGLDWDCVQIGDDFDFLKAIEQFLVDHPGRPLPQAMVQEVNLLYVAMTRARKCLNLNLETRDWFSNLAAHREKRFIAERIHHFALAKTRGE